jgi:hypothetical protein
MLAVAVAVAIVVVVVVWIIKYKSPKEPCEFLWCQKKSTSPQQRLVGSKESRPLAVDVATQAC